MPVYKGWKAKIYLDDVEVGYVEDWRLNIEVNSEAYFEAGMRNPSTIIPGERLLQGSFRKAWVNSYYLNLLGSSNTFDLNLTTQNMGFLLKECKLSKGSLVVNQDGILTEDFQFIAKDIQPYQFTGQLFKNNSFETGDLSYWSHGGLVEVGGAGYHGSHAVFFYGTGCFIEQDFESIYGVPIPVSLIKSMYFYGHDGANVSKTQWIVTYSDGTTYTKHFDLYNTWTKCDVLRYLNKNKKLKKFKINTYHAIGQNWWYADYFILEC